MFFRPGRQQQSSAVMLFVRQMQGKLGLILVYTNRAMDVRHLRD